MELPENFFIVKQGIGFHSNMKDTVPDFHYGVRQTRSGYHGAMDQGLITEHGFNHMLDCVIAMKEVLGDKVSLALDCGPGWMLPDAIRFARAVEKYNIMWLEDMLTGDYVPWVNPQAYRELTAVDLDADPHRRADLPAPQLQGTDRDPGRAHRRARPGRCRRHRRTQMGRRARLHALDPDGAARHRQRSARPRRVDQRVRHAARQLHRVRISDRVRPWWNDIVMGLPDSRIVNEFDDRPPTRTGPWSRHRRQTGQALSQDEDAGFFD